MIITDKAKVFIEGVMTENGVSTLRFTFESAGCCGPSYRMVLEAAHEGDRIAQINGIEVAMEPKVADVVQTLMLDYEEDEHGAGLVVSGGSSCC
jgi:Fe-S cluster assembly iron-binding protein IscA